MLFFNEPPLIVIDVMNSIDLYYFAYIIPFNYYYPTIENETATILQMDFWTVIILKFNIINKVIIFKKLLFFIVFWKVGASDAGLSTRILKVFQIQDRKYLIKNTKYSKMSKVKIQKELKICFFLDFNFN